MHDTPPEGIKSSTSFSPFKLYVWISGYIWWPNETQLTQHHRFVELFLETNKLILHLLALYFWLLIRGTAWKHRQDMNPGIHDDSNITGDIIVAPAKSINAGYLTFVRKLEKITEAGANTHWYMKWSQTWYVFNVDIFLHGQQQPMHIRSRSHYGVITHHDAFKTQCNVLIDSVWPSLRVDRHHASDREKLVASAQWGESHGELMMAGRADSDMHC